MGGAYKGRKAAGYDEKRTKQKKWHNENALVAEYFDAPIDAHVLDCPFGTGRFIKLYRERGVQVDGVDVSEEMLDIALGKSYDGDEEWLETQVGDITALGATDQLYDTAVCIRLLHLLREADVTAAMKELTRVTARCIILTVPLRDAYAEQSDTSCQDNKKFRRLITRLGWTVAKEKCITSGGWTVMKLLRKGTV